VPAGLSISDSSVPHRPLSTNTARRKCETWKLRLAERCVSSLGAVGTDITISPGCNRIVLPEGAVGQLQDCVGKHGVIGKMG
jgi:hypothetical protein